MADAGAIKNVHADDNHSTSFKFKQKITGVTAADGTKNVEIKTLVPLKHLSNF